MRSRWALRRWVGTGDGVEAAPVGLRRIEDASQTTHPIGFEPAFDRILAHYDVDLAGSGRSGVCRQDALHVLVLLGPQGEPEQQSTEREEAILTVGPHVRTIHQLVYRIRVTEYDEAPIHHLAEIAGEALEQATPSELFAMKVRREVALHWLWGDFSYPARKCHRYRWVLFRRKVAYCWEVLRDLWRLL